MVKAALIGIVLALTGCATSQTPSEPRLVWCDHNQPRRPSPEAVHAMTRADLDEVNEHNSKGGLWCGWTP